MDDVPWYGVGPSEPTPIPILGPDIIDPRQMDLIRRQAQLAAAGKPFGFRELPPLKPVDTPKMAPKVKAATEVAAKPVPAASAVIENKPVAVAAEAPVAPGDSAKPKFDKQAMLAKDPR